MTDSQLYKYLGDYMPVNFNTDIKTSIFVNSEPLEPAKEVKKKGQPKFINLENFKAKKANEEREEREKN